MTWTQPICNDCWRQQHGDRTPVRLKEPEDERCCYCGRMNRSGIYVRADPRVVPFPRKDDES